jgi:hypothetical protein
MNDSPVSSAPISRAVFMNRSRWLFPPPFLSGAVVSFFVAPAERLAFGFWATLLVAFR